VASTVRTLAWEVVSVETSGNEGAERGDVVMSRSPDKVLAMGEDHVAGEGLGGGATGWEGVG